MPEIIAAIAAWLQVGHFTAAQPAAMWLDLQAVQFYRGDASTSVQYGRPSEP